MPSQNEDLHGSAPDKCDVAVLIMDMINALDFLEGDQLLERALPIANRIAALKQQAKRNQFPVI
jgi:hypothetical protein